MERLRQSALARLSPAIRRPQYDRDRLAIGMAHIGVGAFHRCHQAEFTDDALEAQFGPWGIVGINLRPPRLAKLLAPQDGLFTRTLRQGDRAETRVVGAIREILDVEDQASTDAAVAALASPAIGVVTMTVTEKGYCHIPSSGALDWTNSELRRDRDSAAPPATIFGLLTRVFERRKAAGANLTVISCDNLPSNGALLRRALTEFIAAAAPALSSWVEAHVSFPSTMVDRIAPAPTEADVAYASEAIGAIDEAAVVGEPFRQWVIEDSFFGDRPPWERADAQFVADVKPYELIKMRVLNAAQSTLSHLGAILGLTYSYEAALDPLLSTLMRRMLTEETASTLPTVSGMVAQDYIDASLGRIANSAIRHRCHQIGTDGSQKIVQRLVNPLRERLAAGQEPGFLALAVASWMAYCLCGARRFGARWRPDDPWAERVIAIGEQTGGDFAALATALLSLDAIFGADLAASPARGAIAAHLDGLLSADQRLYLAKRLSHS
jgi:fructuronate reductase